MTERIRFLREQTTSSANKINRRPIPIIDTSAVDADIPIRKALAFKEICETMPLFIGEQELIVGTRTFFNPQPGNEDGHDHMAYFTYAAVKYINEQDIARFGGDYSGTNKTHYTPDYTILLDNGISGIIQKAEVRKEDPPLRADQLAFLDSVILVYTGLKNLILRYAVYAGELAQKAEDSAEKARLLEIARVCNKIAQDRPDTFREAVQLYWFGHLGSLLESSLFINYGRLDVTFGKYLGDTPKEEAQELLECLLLKFYDQADLNDGSYIDKHQGQLVVTLGGVLENGESAVNDVTMLMLAAAENTNLPEPEFNLRLSSKNPPEFLDKAAELTVKGYNFISYYNDDRFVESLIGGGLSPEDARSYGFDLCQDINIPGKGDFYLEGAFSLAHALMTFLRESGCAFASFEELLSAFKAKIAQDFKEQMAGHYRTQENIHLYRDGKFDEYFKNVHENGINPSWTGRNPMCPLPYLSALYHGTVENAADMIYESFPIKAKGAFVGTAVEAVNSLAAIKKVVFEEKRYTLKEVLAACETDFAGQEVMRSLLWNAPKWGNDDAYVDSIAKDLLEFILRDFQTYKTASGGRILSGIHQPHPVSTGWDLIATPDGRHSGKPVSVTMTPASGTMKNGATAALKSASIFDPSLIQWNYCVMINYYASIFAGEEGKELFKSLLLSYFKRGGMQHQPNVTDARELKNAQREPEKYKDLIVRLWGVSAHFVDLPKELQDEMIARFS